MAPLAPPLMRRGRRHPGETESHGIIAAALTTLAGRRTRRPAFQHCCRATRTSRRQCAHSCIISRNGPAVASHACRSSQRIMAELPEQRRAPDQAVDDAGALVLPPPRVHAVRLAMAAEAVPEPRVTSYRQIRPRSDRFGRVLSSGDLPRPGERSRQPRGRTVAHAPPYLYLFQLLCTNYSHNDPPCMRVS